ncbi:MAG: bifunctional 4-hydroxy-3-methylbut-2-enyl diphosphate reductase/30S ribosomal protein S1 [Oscillospiraceae bacterium]
MKLRVAKSAGFCYGVERAVTMAEQAAATGAPCVMLGPVIHNDAVIARLKEQNIACVERVDEVAPGATVILRSHGEGEPVHKKLLERGNVIVDTTCPNVSKIHRIVVEAKARGRRVAVIGTHDHPEVEGIAGWCQDALVLSGTEELETWLRGDPLRCELPLTFVSQTTAIRRQWDDCIKIAKKECTNVEIFDTICSATHNRQLEAQKLAAECDAMLVIGDKKSSNTRRLAELCRNGCAKVLCVQSAADIDLSLFEGTACVGITAGASTPGWIIKEVCNKMSDEIMEIEESFAELLEKSIKTLHTGEKVTGVVTGVSAAEISVDLGTKHAGFIPLAEYTDDPTVKMENEVKVGDQIETFVVRVNDAEGIVTLSKKRLDSIKGWEDVEKAQEDRTTMEGIVTEENKGGIVVTVKGVRVFVPASQTGLPRDAAMSEMLKKKVKLRITEVNSARRRVVGSIRAVEYEDRASKASEVWESIEAGKKYSGTVKSLTSYGAFVDIGGVDGMVHISELSWSRVKHPSEVVSVGDKVDVYVISFDAEKKKISLGMKDRSEDPWTKFTESFKVDDEAEVRIVKLMTFGAFAEIVPGVDGLIHISQIADHRIDKPGDAVSEGDVVKVRITEIDFEHKKVSLSIRALLEGAQAQYDEETMAHTAEGDVIVAVSDGAVTEVAPAPDAE